jgi:AcrR family transcriptional regulator
VPKIVDHDARRAEIARAVLRVVAREGVGGVTLRRVAEEAGWSTGVINHYFGDKKGMLLGAIREAALGVGDRMTSTLQIDDADDRIRSLLEAGMPLDAERAAMCRIFFYFWAEGIVDAELGAELADYYAWWRTQVRAAVEAAQARGRFASFDAGDLSESLVALADGLGVQSMFDEITMNAERLRGHIALIIDRLDSTPRQQETSSHG